MIRVLHVVSVLNSGGMENYIMNLYRNIDREKIQFDFLVHHSCQGFFDDEVKKLGGKIFRMTVLDDKNIFKYINDLKSFFANHKEYKIVHGHLSSLAYFYLGAAKKAGVKNRISHSHGAGFLKSPKGYAKYLLFRLAKINANVRFACSTEAGKYLFGDNTFEFVPNAINNERFAFNEKIREEMRNQLGVSEDFVIGHVGRFNLQKNHEYLLKVFQSTKKVVPNAKLLLLGEGELKDKIVDYINNLGLSNSVILAGVQRNCEDYYQAMDVFVLPSLFEGLPLTGIEAQYNGLYSVFSNKITRDVVISDLAYFVDIGDRDIQTWASKLLSIHSNGSGHINQNVTKEDFNIEIATKKMTERYFEMWEKSE